MEITEYSWKGKYGKYVRRVNISEKDIKLAIIGMTIKELCDYFRDELRNKHDFRIVIEDGLSIRVDDDSREDRFNVEIFDGKVVRVIGCF